MSIRPLYLLVSALAFWVNREQAAIIDYLREENHVLRERLGSKRLRFTDVERRRLDKLVHRRLHLQCARKNK